MFIVVIVRWLSTSINFICKMPLTKAYDFVFHRSHTAFYHRHCQLVNVPKFWKLWSLHHPYYLHNQSPKRNIEDLRLYRPWIISTYWSNKLDSGKFDLFIGHFFSYSRQRQPSSKVTIADAEWIDFMRLILRKPLEHELKSLLDKYKMVNLKFHHREASLVSLSA